MRRFPLSALLVGTGIIVASISTTVPSADAASLKEVYRVTLRSPSWASSNHNSYAVMTALRPSSPEGGAGVGKPMYVQREVTS
jgi:hypothetical protein